MLPSATNKWNNFYKCIVYSYKCCLCYWINRCRYLHRFYDRWAIHNFSFNSIRWNWNLNFYSLFFAFFFRGSSSFKEGLNTKDFIAHEGLKDVFRAALNVVIFTLAVEAVGAIFIYSSILEVNTLLKINFTSIFHSIRFCNAGFSYYKEFIR